MNCLAVWGARVLRAGDALERACTISLVLPELMKPRGAPEGYANFLELLICETRDSVRSHGSTLSKLAYSFHCKWQGGSGEAKRRKLEPVGTHSVRSCS